MNRNKKSKNEILEQIARLEEELVSLREQLDWEHMTSSGKTMAVAIDDRSFRTNIEQVLTGALDAVVGTNQLGRIIFWNDRAEEIFGWQRKEAQGKKILELIIPKRYREAYERGWTNFLKSREALKDMENIDSPILNKRLSMTALRSNGEEFPVEISVVPIRQGDTQFFSAFIQDVSERKKVIDNLKNAKEASEKASKAKDEFIAQVSHEIRTPLNGIYGMLQLALDTELSEEQIDYLVTAKRSAEVLTGIVDDILDFSKIESGQLSLVLEPFDLHESVAEVVQLFSFNASKKGLALNYEIADDIPNILIGDWNRIRQIFLNLISNALKFTDKGGISVSVALEDGKDRSDDEVAIRCEVVDTGIGIPNEKKNSIFEAFIQADSSVSRNYGGTGLGLTIAHKLVEMMNGWIWLESEEGKGSKFSFVIILQKPAYSDGKLSLKASNILQDLSVLVVDEDAVSRKVLALMLESWHMKVKSVTSNADAVKELLNAHNQGTPYSIAIIDSGSQEMEGLDLVAQIRNDPKFFDMPILLLSQSGRSKVTLDVSELNILHVVSKPVSENRLFTALSESIERYPQLRERIQSASTSGISGLSYNILIAEDDKVNQKIVSLLLSRRGHKCTIVENGQEVLKELAKAEYDAVIMDLQMPTMDGITATKLIRAQEEETGKHITIIASTAYATRDEREKFIDAGVDDYISKPFSSSELFRKLEELCSTEEAILAVPETSNSLTTTTLIRSKFIQDLFQNDWDLIKEASETFISTLPEYKKIVQDSNGHGSLEAATHRIRGAVGNLGAEEVVETLNRLEQAAREEKEDQIKKLKTVLIDQLEKMALELSEMSRNDG
ncbi:MAG: response regulator [Cyanobacteria bacterium HKST-UBA01]|nr:response regulator [Cyanobacteria bacterium HKST-UBA01]